MPNFAFARKFPWSLLIAITLCVAVWAVKMALEVEIGLLTPFLLFFGAIVLATWIGGLGVGIFSTLLSVVLVDFHFFPPYRSLSLLPEGRMQMAVFVLEGFFIALMTALARSAQENFSAQVERQQALAQLSQLALSNSDNLQPLFERASELGARTLRASRVALLELERVEGQDDEPGADYLVPRAAHPKAQNNARLPLAPDSPAARVLNTGPAVGELSGELHFPVGAVERYWGVLQIEAPATRAWTPEEIEWTRAVANILGVAIAGQTARERAEEGETRYRTFVAQSSEAIWRIEMEDPLDLSLARPELLRQLWDCGVLAECNDIFARMYGFESAPEMIGMRLWQIIKRDDPAALAYLERIVDSGFRLSDAESVQFDADGRRHISLTNLVGIVENNYLLRIWGTQRDVTREREAARELRESENRFRLLFDAAPVPLGIGRDSRVLYANEALTRLLGYDEPAQIIGCSITEFVAPEARAEIAGRARNRAVGGEEPASYESRARRRDGSTFPARAQIAQISLPDGEATLMFLFDLTVQKNSDAAIAELLENARRATSRAQELQRISFDLLQSRVPEDVARLALERIVPALGAQGGVLMAPDDPRNPQLLQVLHLQGYPEGALDPFFSIDINAPHPMAHVYRTRESLWMNDAAAWCDEFPSLRQTLPITKTRAIAIIPLEVETRVVSVMALSFEATREFSPDQRLFLLTLANSCAQALERARLDAQTRELARSQRESLALLNTILDSAPVGFALLDRNGHYVLVNDAFAAMNGAPAEIHIGKTTREMAPNAEFEQRLAQVWQSGRPSEEFVLMSERDGIERSCLASLYPVCVSGGERPEQILGVGAIVIDISQRVRAEAEKSRLVNELETERARFEAILQQMPSGVILSEAPTGRMLLSNPQVERVMGTKITLKDFDDYGSYPVFRTDGSRVNARDWPLTRAIESGEIVVDEELLVPHRESDGGIDNRVVRVTAAPIRNREGEITAGIAILDDVTARARTDSGQRFLAAAGSALIATLDETSAHERLAQLCVPDIADWCITAMPGEDDLLHDAQIVYANGSEPARASAHERLAQRFRELLRLDSHLPWDIKAALQSGRARVYARQDLETLRHHGASESYIALLSEIGVRSVVLAPLTARGRNFGVMLWISTTSGRIYDQFDVELAEELARRAALTSDNARLLRESRQAREEAESANRAKDEFLAVVSHELRTPLTPILGWLDLLRSPGMTDALRTQAFDVIERNARAQAQLVNDILDVSRITSGKLRLTLQRIDLTSVVRDAIESHRVAADEKGVIVRLDLESVGAAMLDAARFQQVVWNLFSNAIKFTPAGGAVSISLKTVMVANERMAQLEISDNGTGIAPEFLPRVFEAFRQADSSSTRKAGGLGLGLAIVHHIVERHGGKVEAFSTGEDQGATFRVQIPLLAPLSPGSFQNNKPSSTVNAKATINGARVLVVDDEADTRETIARLLEQQGARVWMADSAVSALEALEKFAPQIVVSDIGMPITDGYTLLGQLRARKPDLPAIALTAYATPADIERALHAGFQKHLSKPIEIDALSEAIRTLLSD